MNSRKCLENGVRAFSGVCYSHTKNAAGDGPSWRFHNSRIIYETFRWWLVLHRTPTQSAWIFQRYSCFILTSAHWHLPKILVWGWQGKHLHFHKQPLQKNTENGWTSVHVWEQLLSGSSLYSPTVTFSSTSRCSPPPRGCRPPLPLWSHSCSLLLSSRLRPRLQPQRCPNFWCPQPTWPRWWKRWPAPWVRTRPLCNVCNRSVIGRLSAAS